MASGKKERVMISCVTFETVKITEPVKFYDVNRVHLIHYVRDPKSYNGLVYQEFYDEVCKIIRKNSDGKIETKEYEEKISQFLPMLKLILNIIDKELGSKNSVELYINVSAGTSEYTAAAVVAAMMNPSVIPFSVSTDEYTVKNEDIRNAYYRNGSPVGLTETILEPMMMPKYNMPMPDKNLVLGLRVLDEVNKSKRGAKGPDVIKRLKEKGLWIDQGELDLDRPYDTSPGKSDSVYYHRFFTSKWTNNGWVEMNDFPKRYRLTEEGQRIIGTFYTE